MEFSHVSEPQQGGELVLFQVPRHLNRGARNSSSKVIWREQLGIFSSLRAHREEECSKILLCTRGFPIVIGVSKFFPNVMLSMGGENVKIKTYNETFENSIMLSTKYRPTSRNIFLYVGKVRGYSVSKQRPLPYSP